MEAFLRILDHGAQALRDFHFKSQGQPIHILRRRVDNKLLNRVADCFHLSPTHVGLGIGHTCYQLLPNNEDPTYEFKEGVHLKVSQVNLEEWEDIWLVWRTPMHHEDIYRHASEIIADINKAGGYSLLLHRRNCQTFIMRLLTRILNSIIPGLPSDDPDLEHLGTWILNSSPLKGTLTKYVQEEFSGGDDHSTRGIHGEKELNPEFGQFADGAQSFTIGRHSTSVQYSHTGQNSGTVQSSESSWDWHTVAGAHLNGGQFYSSSVQTSSVQSSNGTPYLYSSDNLSSYPGQYPNGVQNQGGIQGSASASYSTGGQCYPASDILHDQIYQNPGPYPSSNQYPDTSFQGSGYFSGGWAFQQTVEPTFSPAYNDEHSGGWMNGNNHPRGGAWTMPIPEVGGFN